MPPPDDDGACRIAVNAAGQGEQTILADVGATFQDCVALEDRGSCQANPVRVITGHTEDGPRIQGHAAQLEGFVGTA